MAVLCGLSLAVVNFAKLLLLDRVGAQVALVVSLTLVVTVAAAKFIGCTLPLLAKKSVLTRRSWLLLLSLLLWMHWPC